MKKLVGLFLISYLLVGCGETTKKTTTETNVKHKYEAAVSTVSKEATQVGIDILNQGGNAFDAAIAVHFALAVTYPEAGNLGGGGFTVYHDEFKESGCIDYREKAPLKATENMFLDEKGNVIKGLSLYGALAGGVPGSVDGMWEIHQSKGSMPWKDLLQPAIKLAKTGFTISSLEAEKLNNYQTDFVKYNSDTIPFVRNWKEGDTLIQKALGRTIELIADSGAGIFYTGLVGKMLATNVQENGGIITRDDLIKYSAAFREPVKGNYRTYEILSMPPSSSGGIALIQLLNGAEKFPIRGWGHNSPKTLHIYTELMRRVYADRTTFLGDPEFYPVPTEKLVDKNYLDERFIEISDDKKTNSSEVKSGKADRIESYETTHYSILDNKGNVVSTTTTLNGNYGSKVWLPAVGFFLNNEMDDFSAKAGVPNQFGLIGGKANSIEPEKRMLSSMTPTIVLKEGEPKMIVGTPGGSTIITSVFQTILNVLEFDMELQAAVDAPKMHHQWQPDLIILEKNKFDENTISALKEKGHVIEFTDRLGIMNCIFIDENKKSQAVGDITRYTGFGSVIKNE